jgi:hypothetical protein
LQYKRPVKNKIAWNIKVFFAPYYSNNQIKNTEVGGGLARVGERKGINIVSLGKPEEK